MDRFQTPDDPRPNDVVWPVLTWPPASGTVLRGGAIELRQADPEQDSAELFAALDHDRVWAHVAGRPAGVGELSAQLAGAPAAGRWVWVARLVGPLAGLPAGAVVGMTSYLDASPSDARLEVGWTAYAPAVWGSVVNPEAKFLLLEHAFEVMGAGRVQIKTDIRNIRSQQAIARLGATFEGVLRRYQRRADGTVRDTVMFSVLAEEWPRVKVDLGTRAMAI